MLRLRAPYGHPAGKSLTLLSNYEAFDHEEVEKLLLGFGCPLPQMVKAISCLHYSGHFECRIRDGIVAELRECAPLFNWAGIQVRIGP